MRQPPGWGVSRYAMGGTPRQLGSRGRGAVMARRWMMGVVCVLAMASAPGAQAGTRADVAATERLATFTLKRLGPTPATIRAGSSFRVRGRVANAKRRRAQTARLTFSLRTSRSSLTRGKRRLDGTN